MNSFIIIIKKLIDNINEKQSFQNWFEFCKKEEEEDVKMIIDDDDIDNDDILNDYIINDIVDNIIDNIVDNNIDNNDTNKLNFHYVKHAFAWCDKSHFFYIIINECLCKKNYYCGAFFI